MHTVSNWSRPTPAALLLAAAVGSGCGTGRPERETPAQGVTAISADCPQHTVAIARGESTITNIPLAADIDEIPEFHDCQRFLPRDGDVFGPLIAIWVSTHANTVTPVGARRPPDEPAALVAPALDTSARALRPSAASLPIAVIHSWDGDYNPLEIVQGFNCLFLVRSPEEPSGFKARIAKIEGPLEQCMEPLHPDILANGKTLPLRAFPIPPALSSADIPEVARWDRTMQNDRNRGLYYIGIRCGYSWCEIGPYPSSPRHNDLVADMSVKTLRDEHMSRKPVPQHIPVLTERGAARVREVKGWYDEQRLALPDAKHASRATGVAFPQPQLDEITDSTDFDTLWVPSAYLLLDDHYQGKHLDLRKGVTTVEICHGTATGCKIPVAPACKSATAPASRVWWAKLTPEGHKASDETGNDPSKKIKYVCVRRERHGGAVIPRGAARWAWSDKDESLWIRCADGCCTTD